MLAALARQFRDLDLTEDALADAFAAAAGHWAKHGAPANPAAWLFTAARRKALDRLRRRATAGAYASDGSMEQAHPRPLPQAGGEEIDPDALPDERLALIFTCCHPALALEARVALTLRLVTGLTTAEVARLFLVGEPTMAARLTRAKKKIAAAGIPFGEPPPAERGDRIGGVLAVIYLLFTEGYVASAGGALIRHELADEAIRLGALLHDLSPVDDEATALLALMLFQHARRDARLDADGALVTLPEQDRARWRHDEIARARTLIAGLREDGPYRLQAEIAAAHCREGSDWRTIAALYARLEQRAPSPAVRINRAVAVAEAEGAPAGLALLSGLTPPPTIAGKLALVTGELLARVGRIDEARAAALATNAVEQRHLARRAAALAATEP